MWRLFTSRKVFRAKCPDTFFQTRRKKSMKKKLLICSLGSIIFMANLSFAGDPESRISRADKLYSTYAYSKAIPIYEEMLKKDNSNVDLLSKLADCYRLTNQTHDAMCCYRKIVTSGKWQTPQLFYYVQSLMSNGQYDEANEWAQKYVQAKPDDARGQEIISSIENLQKLILDSTSYSIKEVSICSKESEFSPVFYRNGVVFVSTKAKNMFKAKNHSWTGKGFLSMYYSKIQGDTLSEPEVFASDLQVAYNNGPATFNPAFDQLYFTRNNMKAKKIALGNERVYKLKLIGAKLVDGKWIEDNSFPYNNDQYNCAHACFSPDGSKLYFASDMPGGMGGMDLWVCKRDGNSWSKPENLGPSVNTLGNELFPTMSGDGSLYFSSNGRGGLGGLDIFRTVEINGSFVKAKNIGAPLNSSSDDFGYIYDTKLNLGFLSSNRSLKASDDNIYTFSKQPASIKILVYDKMNQVPLGKATILIKDNGRNKEPLFTSVDGIASTTFDTTHTYGISINRESYEPAFVTVTPAELVKIKDGILRIGLDHITVFDLHGSIYASIDSKPVVGAKVILRNLINNSTKEIVSGTDGHYSFDQIDGDAEFEVLAEKSAYTVNTKKVSTKGFSSSQSLTADLLLQNQVDSLLNLENIYYDLDKYNILPAASVILDKVVDVMNAHPNTKIECGSHTDSRASDGYNLILSQKRAQSVIDYLVARKIDPARLVAKGYGETQLLNQCSNGQKCTEEEHQLNRRTEFKIISM